MAAPDYETLYDIENTIEPAICDVLETATSLDAANVLRWLSGGDANDTPRLEVELRVGEPVTKKVDQASVLRHAAWACDLVIRVITHHDRDTAATHYTKLKQVRAAIEGWQGDYLIDDLPYHAIKRMVWQSTTNTIQERERITEITIATVVEIRSDAWPVV